MSAFMNIFRRESAQKPRKPPSESTLKAEITLVNHAYGIVVHPGDNEPGSEDTTTLSGSFFLKSDSTFNVCGTRVSFIVPYRFKRPKKDTWEEVILYEQSELFICGDKRDAIIVEYDEHEDLITRRINFGIVVPKDIATYEYLPAGGFIQPHIRVSVELDNINWHPDALRALPAAPPGYMDEGTVVLQDDTLNIQRWTGGSVIPHEVMCTSQPTFTTGSLSPGSTSAHRVQTWTRNILISANPNPSMGPSNLRCHRRGVAAGIGEWNAYLWSDSFSVASYIIPRIELSHMATACNIYSIELQLVQTYSIIPYDVYQIGGYDPEEYRYPSDSFPLMTYGEKPKTNRPGLDAKALWRGTDQPEEEDAKRFEWEAAEPVRLPVAQEIRPSTFQGTKTPIEVKHKFVIKVYFSVTGETVTGEQIPNANGVGHLRMLIINIEQPLPSCTCVNEWVTLPDYKANVLMAQEPQQSQKLEEPQNAQQAQTAQAPQKFQGGQEPSQPDEKKEPVPICACCYRIEQFPVSPFTKAFPKEEAEQRERLAPLPTQCKSPVGHTAGSF